MSQQGAAGRGRGCGSSRGKSKYYPQGGVDATKAFKSTISKIAEDTFKTGQNKFAAQFTQSRKNVSNYLQHTLAYVGYLVAKMVRTSKKQIIELPPAVDESAADAEDQKIIREALEAIIRAEEVKTVAKRQLKLGEALKKGYATIYNQCSQEVRDKLESTDDWDKTQKEQSLEELIRKIKRICVGFDDHKQEVFNLVQAVKTLYIYTQGEKESVEEYGRNFKSLWDTVEAFGGSPGVHKGLAAIMLMQNASQESTEPEGVALVQTVRQTYEGYTKREVLRAKEARRAQAMILCVLSSGYMW